MEFATKREKYLKHGLAHFLISSQAVLLTRFLSTRDLSRFYTKLRKHPSFCKFQNDPEFEKLVSRLAKGFENTGFLDIFCPVRILESRFLKWRQDTIFEPFNYILELNKKSIARRVAQLKADEHVLSDDPDDFLDAYLLKMQKDKNEGLETTFT